MFHWLHHLLNPHCPQCQEEAEDKKICSSCETLKMQLSIANHEKQELLNTVLAISKPAAREETSPAVNYENLKPKMMTWNVRKQMLEAEDRKAAQLLAEQRKNAAKQPDRTEQIEELEKELGIDEGVKANG